MLPPYRVHGQCCFTESMAYDAYAKLYAAYLLPFLLDMQLYTECSAVLCSSPVDRSIKTGLQSLKAKYSPYSAHIRMKSQVKTRFSLVQPMTVDSYSRDTPYSGVLRRGSSYSSVHGRAPKRRIQE